jgi:hypothetical protein
LEAKIKKYKNRLFINTSDKGAKISGSVSMDLAEAIERYCKDPFEKGFVERLTSPLYSEEKVNKLKTALKGSFGGKVSLR